MVEILQLRQIEQCIKSRFLFDDIKIDKDMWIFYFIHKYAYLQKSTPNAQRVQINRNLPRNQSFWQGALQEMHGRARKPERRALPITIGKLIIQKSQEKIFTWRVLGLGGLWACPVGTLIFNCTICCTTYSWWCLFSSKFIVKEGNHDYRLLLQE